MIKVSGKRGQAQEWAPDPQDRHSDLRLRCIGMPGPNPEQQDAAGTEPGVTEFAQVLCVSLPDEG